MGSIVRTSRGKDGRRSAAKLWAAIEPLESRILFSVLTPVSSGVASAAIFETGEGFPSPIPEALTPLLVQGFYGFGEGSSSNGSGQTIAVVAWGNDPEIEDDLGVFDTEYGNTGSGTLSVYAQDGTADSFALASTLSGSELPPDASTYPGNPNGSTDGEISLDVEWVHALAPGANIDLVEARDGTISNLSDAINYAKALSGVSVVSMSFGATESIPTFSDSTLSEPNVAFVASSGDYGSYNNPTYYASQSFSGAGTGLSDGDDSYQGESIPSTTGDFFFVTQIQSGTTGTQAGISIRNDDGGSGPSVANFSILALPSSTGKTGVVQYRSADGSGITLTASSGFSAPVGDYLAVLRQGTEYTAYTSPNGFSWTQVGSVNILAMNGDVTIEIVGASGSSTASATYNFGNIAAYGGTTAPQSPASSSGVISVGGTELSVTDNLAGTVTSINSETSAWGDGALSLLPGGNTFFPVALQGGGSGGGYSGVEPLPAFQNGISMPGNTGNGRGVPDVAFDGGTGVSVYDSDTADSDGTESSGWDDMIGTSLGAPAWAALIAIADQVRSSEASLPALSSQEVLSDLYSLPSSDFNQAITSGSNGAYSAGPAWNPVTGLGTPIVGNLVPALASWTTWNTIANGDNVTVASTPSNTGFTITEGTSSTTVLYSQINTSDGGITIDTGNFNNTVTVVQSNGNIQVPLNIQSLGTATLVVQNGSITFNSNAGAAVTSLIMNVHSPGTATFAVSQMLTSLVIASGAEVISSAAIYSSTITDNGSLIFDSIAGFNQLKAISGSGGSVTQEGPGAITLYAANTYTGGTVISGGAMVYDVNNALPTTGTVTINGGTLAFQFYFGTIGGLTLNGGAITGSAGGKVVGSTYQLNDGTVSAVLDGTGFVTVSGTEGEIVSLTAANTYSGGTTLSSGVLNVTSGAIPSSGSVRFNGGTLQYASGNTTDYTSRFSNAANQDYNIDTGGNNVTFATALTSTGGELTKLGAGTLALSAMNSYSDGTTIGDGALIILATNALPDSGTLNIATGAALQIEAGTSANVVIPQISGNGTLTLGTSSTGADAQLIYVTGGESNALGSLVLNSGSTLDITDNSIAVNYGAGMSPASTIAGYLASGYGAGAWTGTGIVSSTAAAKIEDDDNPIRSIGYADGSTDSGTAAAASQVLIKYTLAGDANLDGNVDFNDLFAVGKRFNTTGNDWANGNFNYAMNGATDFNDLFIVGQNLNTTSAAPDWLTYLSTHGTGFAMTEISNGDGGFNILIAGGTSTGDMILFEVDAGTGDLVTSFGTDGIVLTNINGLAAAEAIAVRGDGDIVIAGYGTDAGDSDYDIAVAEFHSDGSPVISFGDDGVALSDVGATSDGKAYAFGITLLGTSGDGDILISGVDGDGLVLEEFTTAGALDSSFGSGGVVSDLDIDVFTPNTVTVLSGGNILVSGGDGTDAVLAEFNSDGTLDTSFGSGGVVVSSQANVWQSIVILSGGDILAVGVNSADGGQIVLGEFQSDGSANTSFGTSGFTYYDAYTATSAVTLSVSEDGEILVGAISDPEGEAIVLAQFTSAGALDTTYGDSGTSILWLDSGSVPWAISPDGSGGVLVIGSYDAKLYIADVETGS